MIDNLVSKRVIGLESYKVESLVPGIALDKNEIPWSLGSEVVEAIIKRVSAMEFNRYPDSNCTQLKAAISRYTGIANPSIGVGNGSDELISILLQTFINPGDTIAVQNPSFSMYKIYGTICGARIWEYDLDSNFGMDLEEFISSMEREKPKLVFICNPNNPTGSRLELQDIEQLLNRISGIVVIDEAYFEFSGLTAAGLLSDYDNLVILRTFSKAFGLAGLRMGYMLASASVISYIDRVRSPFNVNAFGQAAAIELLENLDSVKERIETIKCERERLATMLDKLEGLQCYKSWSNFLLIRSNYAEEICGRLQEEGVHIRDFTNPRLKACIRVTIGSPLENNRFYEIVKEVLYEKSR